MVRPKWILVLLLVLAVAAVFAGLAQWQLSHAVRLDDDLAVDTETAIAVSEVDEELAAVNETHAGRVVSVTGEFVPEDYFVVGNRMNQDNNGYWVLGHLATTEPENESENGERANYVVAVGWASTEQEAQAAATQAAKLQELADPHTMTGRFLPTEAPEAPEPDGDQQALGTVAPGQLINLWQQPIDGWTSAGFIAAHTDPATLAALGLDAIDSVPPTQHEKINWLNLFYALEWVVFAGFAVYFWVRLTRDAWEREHEIQLQAQEEAAQKQLSHDAGHTLPPVHTHKEDEHGSQTEA